MRLALVAIVTGLIPPPLSAADLVGKVTETGANEVKVELTGDVMPNPNDAATIYFKLPGGDEEVLVANGHVTAVDDGTATVAIDKSFGAVRKDQLARIVSNATKPRPGSSQAGGAEVWGDVEKQVKDLISPQGKYAEASAVLDRFIELNPRNGNAYMYRAICNRVRSDYEKALADVDRALTLGCDTPWRPYCTRAHVHLVLKDFRGAVEDTSKAIEIAPDESDPYVLRAYAKLNVGERKEALGDANKAIELDPKNGGAYACRGWYFASVGATDAAEADWNKAISLDPSLKQQIEEYRSGFAVNELYKQMKEFHAQRRTSEGLAAVERVIELNPRDGGAYVNRAIFELAQDPRNAAKAVEDADRALALGCNDQRLVYAIRGRAQLYQGHFQASIEDSSKAIELGTDYSGPYAVRADARFRLGENEAALADVNTAMRLDPKSGEAYCVRGAYFAQIGDADAAEADWKKAIAIDPSLTAKVDELRAQARAKTAQSKGSDASASAAGKKETPAKRKRQK